MVKPVFRRYLKLLLVVAVILLADQLTKRWVVSEIGLGETRIPIPFLSPLFQLTRSHNTGAAFGFLPQAGDIFRVISTIVVFILLYFYPRIPDEQRLSRVATALIISGALGNVIDRLTYGYVIDFIHYQIPGVISNVSNLADHAIVLGVICFFIASWREERKAKMSAGANASLPSDSTSGSA